MKKIFLLFCSSVSIITTTAQMQTFDITTFIVPKGWKEQSAESSIQFSKEDAAKGTYCLITLYKALPGTGTANENFTMAWTSLVKETINVSAAPEMQPAAKEKGWEALSGFAPFESEGSKGIAVLVTSSGYDKMVNIVILTNTNTYETEMSQFLESIDFKKQTFVSDKPVTSSIKPVASSTSAKKDGFAFSTTNFDDGWKAIEKDDWVMVEKGSVTVLLHYSFPLTNSLRTDIPTSCFNQLVTPRYTIKNIYNYPYSVLKDFPYYFLQADATDKVTGKNVFLSFQVVPKNGVAYCYEIITPTKNEFQQQFSTMDKIAAMSGYNKFAIGSSDLIGTWQEGGGAFTQYYFVSNGNYAGMDIVVGSIKYIFPDQVNYKTDVKAVRNSSYATEKETGSYKVAGWELTTTNQNRKVSVFNAWFEATKGGRILHFLNKKYSSEHYQLGREK